MKKYIVGFLTGVLLALPVFSYAAPSIANRLKGRLLLQVEDSGQAWFVKNDNTRVYMSSPSAAYYILRKYGLGISNKNLEQIPISDEVITTTLDENPTYSSPNTVYVDRVTEKPVEKIVYQDKIVEKPVEVIKYVYVDRSTAQEVTPTLQEQVGAEQKAIANDITCVLPNAYGPYYLKCFNPNPDPVTITGIDIGSYGSGLQETRVEIWDEKDYHYISGYYLPRYDYSITPNSSISNINPLEDKNIITWTFADYSSGGGESRPVGINVKEIRYTINGVAKKAIIK